MHLTEAETQHTDKVTVLEIVTVQLVARLLRIHHVLIDDEGGAFCVARDALPNLTVCGVSVTGRPYREIG